jgi:hypothetical protein
VQVECCGAIEIVLLEMERRNGSIRQSWANLSITVENSERGAFHVLYFNTLY